MASVKSPPPYEKEVKCNYHIKDEDEWITERGKAETITAMYLTSKSKRKEVHLQWRGRQRFGRLEMRNYNVWVIWKRPLAVMTQQLEGWSWSRRKRTFLEVGEEGERVMFIRGATPDYESLDNVSTFLFSAFFIWTNLPIPKVKGHWKNKCRSRIIRDTKKSKVEYFTLYPRNKWLTLQVGESLSERSPYPPIPNMYYPLYCAPLTVYIQF